MSHEEEGREGRDVEVGGCLHMTQERKVPGRVEGGTPKGEGWSSGSRLLASPFAKSCPSLYLLEKACPHAVGLGRMNQFDPTLPKLSGDLLSSSTSSKRAHSVSG